METRPAVELIGRTMEATGAAGAAWLLDRPVSNSGRLATLILEIARDRGWAWRVELAQNPDADLAACEAIVATADSVVLDRCRRWVNLGRMVVDGLVPAARVMRLGT